jgi:hypothetical protein
MNADDIMTFSQMERRLNEKGVDANDGFVKRMRRALHWVGKDVTVEEFERTWTSGAPEMRRKRRSRLTADEWDYMDELLSSGRHTQGEIAKMCGVSRSLVTLRKQGQRGP